MDGALAQLVGARFAATVILIPPALVAALVISKARSYDHRGDRSLVTGTVT